VTSQIRSQNIITDLCKNLIIVFEVFVAAEAQAPLGPSPYNWQTAYLKVSSALTVPFSPCVLPHGLVASPSLRLVPYPAAVNSYMQWLFTKADCFIYCS